MTHFQGAESCYRRPRAVGVDLEGNTMSKQAEFAVILKMNPMFADLGTDELQRISSLCHTQQLGVGEMLFQKGDPGDALYGVRRGQIRIETGASDGSRLTLNFMGPGDLFGEVAVLDGQSRTADATAGEASELFVLRREGRGFAILRRRCNVALTAPTDHPPPNDGRGCPLPPRQPDPTTSCDIWPSIISELRADCCDRNPAPGCGGSGPVGGR